MLNIVVLFWWSSTDRLLPGEVNIDWLCSIELLLLLLLLINVSRHRVRLRSTYSLLWYGPPSDFTTADTDNGFILLQVAVDKCKYTWSLVSWYTIFAKQSVEDTHKFQRLSDNSDMLYEAHNEGDAYRYMAVLIASANSSLCCLLTFKDIPRKLSVRSSLMQLFFCIYYVTCLVVFP